MARRLRLEPEDIIVGLDLAGEQHQAAICRMEGERLTRAELQELLAGTDGLAMVRGKWIEIDRARLQQTLERFRAAEKAAAEGLSFAQAMRLLSGADVAKPTLEALGKRADSRSEWASWKWERLISDSRNGDGGDWYFDLRAFESAARRYLYRRLYRRLHLEGDTYVPLYAYFRIKEFEATAIHGIIEGIKLEAPAAEIAAFALATTGGAA